MSEANKLFDELGYKKIKENHDGWWTIIYNSDDLSIEFTSDKELIITNKNINYENVILNMQELKAINKKCLELGWIEE